MANTNVNPGDTPVQPTTLDAQEYLRWLLSLERASDLPEGTRAYLVSIEGQGLRRLTPVGASESVLDLNRDLLKHLAAQLLDTAFLVSLREFCNDKLRGRGEATLVAVDEERQTIGSDANHEVRQLAELLQHEIQERDSCGEVAPIARGILARIKTLTDVVYEAAFCDEDAQTDLPDLQRVLYGECAST